MRPRDPIALSSLMRRMRPLEQITQQSHELAILNQKLMQHLPRELADHCAVARCDGEALVLVTDTPARAARLRYTSRNILEAMRGEVKNAPARVVVSIAPVQAPARLAPVKRSLSAEASAQLRSLADTVDDSRLAASLRRLASRADD